MKWQKFRDFLVDFKEQEVNIEQMLKDIPKVEVQKCKEQAALRVSIGLKSYSLYIRNMNKGN